MPHYGETLDSILHAVDVYNRTVVYGGVGEFLGPSPSGMSSSLRENMEAILFSNFHTSNSVHAQARFNLALGTPRSET